VSQSASRQAELAAARLLLERMGISPADLLREEPAPRDVPTFAEYVPVVAAAVSPGTRRAYGSYWKRVVQEWGDRRIDEPRPSEIELLRGTVQATVVARRNARGGRSAAEHLVSALRCLYRRATADGYLDVSDNPALKVAKPRRGGCPVPAGRSVTRGWRRSTRWRVMIRPWTACCCACTPRQPAAVAARSHCAPETSTPNSA
jgi:integrase/recombinase XerC